MSHVIEFRYLMSILISLCSFGPGAVGLAREQNSWLEAAQHLGEQAYPRSGTCTANGKICALFTPVDLPLVAIGGLLQSAERKIQILTYNIDRPEYLDILRSKLADPRFESVELLVDFAHTARDPMHFYHQIGSHPKLTKYRSPVFRGSHPQQHNKVIIIDERIVLFGSANFTDSGIVGNYENTMVVRDLPAIVEPYRSEFEEAKALAAVTCRELATHPEGCGSGGESWPEHAVSVLTQGRFDPNGGVVTTSFATNDPGEKPDLCRTLIDRRSSLMMAGNMPRIADRDAFLNCFQRRDIGEAYWRIMEAAYQNERYADGTLVADDPPERRWIGLSPHNYARPYQYAFFRHQDQQTGPYRVYFSGEDGLENKITRELEGSWKGGG